MGINKSFIRKWESEGIGMSLSLKFPTRKLVFPITERLAVSA